MILPTFQAQSPAISGCNLGWSSCTCFAGSMVAAFDQGKSFVMKGCQVRAKTGDSSGGTTLSQVDAALRSGWGVDLDTRYRLPWATFAAKINEGRAAILQGGYAAIRGTKYDAGRGFGGNHAVAVLPGWIAMDPLADGRAPGVYKFHQEAYPQALLKSFAGRLNVSSRSDDSYVPLGSGLVYAAFSRDRVAEYEFSLKVADYGSYTVTNDRITGFRIAHTGGFTARCTPPRLFPWTGHSSQSLVRLLTGSHGDEAKGAGKGQWVRSSHAREL